MFNYFSFERQKNAHEKAKGNILSQLVHKQVRKKTNKKYEKGFNNRIESFMLNMLQEPVVIKKPSKPWKQCLRDPNQNESTERLGMDFFYMKYDPLERLVKRRENLMDQIQKEKKDFSKDRIVYDKQKSVIEGLAKIDVSQSQKAHALWLRSRHNEQSIIQPHQYFKELAPRACKPHLFPQANSCDTSNTSLPKLQNRQSHPSTKKSFLRKCTNFSPVNHTVASIDETISLLRGHNSRSSTSLVKANPQKLFAKP